MTDRTFAWRSPKYALHVAAGALDAAVTASQEETGAGVIEVDAASFRCRSCRGGGKQRQKNERQLEKPFSVNHPVPSSRNGRAMWLSVTA